MQAKKNPSLFENELFAKWSNQFVNLAYHIG